MAKRFKLCPGGVFLGAFSGGMLQSSPNRERFERASTEFTESNKNRFMFKRHEMGSS